METALSLILTISVITNLLIVYAFKKFQSQPVEVELIPAVLESTTGCDCGIGLAEEIKKILLPLLEEKAVNLPSSPDESYFAWTNRAEEPNVAPSSPHKPPPLPAPLARPGGFAL